MAIPTLDDVPYSLMPVAVVLGYYLVVAVLRAWYLVYSSRGGSGGAASRSTSSSGRKSASAGGADSVQFYGLTAVLALFCYAYVVGRIEGAFEKADHASFDPYRALNLTAALASNATVLTAVYRGKVQYYHPSNKETGDADRLRQVLLAYQALTEEEQKRNYETHGHPEGPLLTSMFQVATPSWLFPFGSGGSGSNSGSSSGEGDGDDEQQQQQQRESRIPKNAILAAYGAMTALVALALAKLRGEARRRALEEEDDDLDEDDFAAVANSVRDVDLHHLARNVRPGMTHWEVLQLVLCAPTNVAWADRDLRRIDKVLNERREEMSKQSKRATIMDFDSIVDEGGWADDEGGGDDDENEVDEDEMDLGEKQALMAAKKAEEERKKQLEQLQRATGKATQLLEDLDKDKGVLGQKWVERTLEKAGQWPPKDMSFLTSLGPFEYKGRQIMDPLEHPGLRRMLCMISGRLNSQMLNSHPELLDAGSKKLIDQTYFGSSMMFRQRVGLILEATTQIATSLKCYRLLKTLIEAAQIFRIGCQVGTEDSFRQVMMRQYGCIPTLQVKSTSIATPDEKEIATCDQPQLTLEVERTHAENFLRQKIAQFQKQGIPPQVGLQTYREGWWILVRCERVDGKPGKGIELPEDNFKQLNMTSKMLEVFEREDPASELVAAFPVMLNNVSQKNLKAQLSFDAPDVAGKYKYHISLKSIEFLGCDVEDAELDPVDVVDESQVVRKEKKKKKKDGEETEGTKDSDEPKKTK